MQWTSKNLLHYYDITVYKLMAIGALETHSCSIAYPHVVATNVHLISGSVVINL